MFIERGEIKSEDSGLSCSAGIRYDRYNYGFIGTAGIAVLRDDLTDYRGSSS